MLPINQILLGDCTEALKSLPDNSIDSVVTDPPYGLGKVKDLPGLIQSWLAGENGRKHQTSGFMGKDWDVVPSPTVWREVFRVLKPGGYALVFAGTRTMDLMGLSLRLAGFEVQDSIAWMQGQGFPKGKAALKPSHEPILVCYKPGKRSLNIDECRINLTNYDLEEYIPNRCGWKDGINYSQSANSDKGINFLKGVDRNVKYQVIKSTGRYPSNVILSHHADCIPCGTKRVKGSHDTTGVWRKTPSTGITSVGLSPQEKEASYTAPDGTETIAAYQCHPECPVAILDAQTAGKCNGSWGKSTRGTRKNAMIGCRNDNSVGKDIGFYDEGELGSASRFFLNLPPEAPFIYSPKASKSDRTCGGKVENTHITVKPTQLMAYLVRLVTLENGIVLDPFMGSGSTVLGCIRENRNYIGVELSEEYRQIAMERIATTVGNNP